MVEEALAYVQGVSLKASATSHIVGFQTPRSPVREVYVFTFNKDAVSGSLYPYDYCNKDCKKVGKVVYSAEILIAILLMLGFMLLLKRIARVAVSPIKRCGLIFLGLATVLVVALVGHWSFTEKPLVYVQGGYSTTRDDSITKPQNPPTGMEWRDAPLHNGWALYDTNCLGMLHRTGLTLSLKQLEPCQKDFVSNFKETFDADIQTSFNSFTEFEPYQNWFLALVALIAAGGFMLSGFAERMRHWILGKSTL